MAPAVPPPASGPPTAKQTPDAQDGGRIASAEARAEHLQGTVLPESHDQGGKFERRKSLLDMT